MNVNMLDLIIILFIFFGGFLGFKRGVIKQAVMTFGIIIVLTVSFCLKNTVSLLMYKSLPFMTIGLLKDYSSLNILIYELTAFFLLFSLLSTLLIILIKISGVVEKILRVTVILAIPSKILGFILGLFENTVIIFVIIFVLSNPTFNISSLKNSNLSNFILKNTPVISKYTKNTVKGFDEVGNLLENRNKYSASNFNCKLINILVKNNIVTNNSIDYLYNNGKIDNKCRKGD